MKRVSPAFFNGLKRSDVRLCKCWRIETEDGLVLGFTEHDKVLNIDGVDYVPTNSFSSSAFSQKADMSVDNLNVVALMSDDMSEDDLHAGRFNKADVRIFYVQWDHPEWGTMPIMGARFGEITFMDGTFEAELRSRAQALQQPVGRVHTLECDVTMLGDARCRVDIAPFTVEGEVSSIFDAVTFFDVSRTEEDDWFQYGVITFTSGPNTGLQLEVQGYKLDSKLIALVEPPAYPLEPGTTYSMVAGCDRSCDTCRIKFANLDNFRGFPHMPTEQEATETPDAK